MVHKHHHHGPRTTDALSLVEQAIQAGNFVETGVTFGPLILKTFANTPVGADPFPPFLNFWASRRADTPILFFMYFQVSFSFSPFRLLGDFVTVANGPVPPPDPSAVLMFAPSDSVPDAVAEPIGFEEILTDHGSGNGAAFSYWRIIPPAGYCAMGIAFSSDWTTPPLASNYWCVKEDYVEPCGTSLFWSDGGTHIHANACLRVPCITSATPYPDGTILFAPPTFLSDQDIGNEQAFALRLSPALLPIAPLDPGAPQSGPNVNPGDTTALGIDYVSILPYTAVAAEADLPNQALLYPFYFFASLPFWTCQSVLSTGAGGYKTYTYSIGTSETQSQSIAVSTSLTVDGSVGAQYGSVNGSISVSFTRSFDLTYDSSQTGSSDYSVSVTINFPNQPTTWMWGYVKRIAVFRTDGTLVDTADYSVQEIQYLPDPTPPPSGQV